MSELSNRTFTKEEQDEIRKIVVESVKINREVDDLKAGLNDLIKEKAEMLLIKPALLRAVIRAVYKGNLDEAKAKISDIEEIIEVAKLK